MEKFNLSSKCSLILCFCIAVTYSPLTQAISAVPDTTMLRRRQEVEELADYNNFEGNATLQKLVESTYGVNISGVLDLISTYNNYDDTDQREPSNRVKQPEWISNLVVHLVKGEIHKSSKTLKLTPNTFKDDGKWYMEFTCEAYLTINETIICTDIQAIGDKPLAISDKQEKEIPGKNTTLTWVWPLFSNMNGTSIFCTAPNIKDPKENKTYSDIIPIAFQTVVEKVANSWGPWVWPSSRVVKYNDTTPVNVTCWVWLDKGDSVFWYHDQGSDKTEKLAMLTQKNFWSYVKLEMFKMFKLSDNSTEISCGIQSLRDKSSVNARQQNLTLMYYKSPVEVRKTRTKPKVTPETYVDDGGPFLELSCEAYLEKGDQLSWIITRNKTKETIAVYEELEEEGTRTLELHYKLTLDDNTTEVVCVAEGKTGEKTLSDKVPIVFKKGMGVDENERRHETSLVWWVAIALALVGLLGAVLWLCCCCGRCGSNGTQQSTKKDESKDT